MGERFGAYELIGRIGGGGMADVYLGQRAGVGGFSRIYAIKRMLAGLSRDEDSVQMFLAEARFGATLTHPNIVQILDVGQVEGTWYIAQEFIDGPDLHGALSRAAQRSCHFGAELAAWIVARVADGLQHAHTLRDPDTGEPLNLVHRDVNHGNILLSRHGEVKITDFGIAKARAVSKATASGVLKGKMGYMAPEQCLERPVDNRTDIFCLGIVLYELLTTRRLFRGANDVETMRQTVHRPTPRPSAHAGDVDSTLDEIVLHCLARPHEQRPASAAAVARRLDAWLQARGAREMRSAARQWLTENALDLCPTTRFGGRRRSRLESQTAGTLEPGLDAYADTARQRAGPDALAEFEAMEQSTERDPGLPAMLELEWAFEAPTTELSKNKGASGSPLGPKNVVFGPHPEASPPMAASESPVSSEPVAGAGGQLTDDER